MRASLNDYTSEEIEKMRKPLGNKNYDVYDLIRKKLEDAKYERVFN